MMARLRACTLPDVWSVWARLLWRAATPCIAITLALALWAVLAADLGAAPRDNLAQDLERTLMAPATLWDETW